MTLMDNFSQLNIIHNSYIYVQDKFVNLHCSRSKDMRSEYFDENATLFLLFKKKRTSCLLINYVAYSECQLMIFFFWIFLLTFKPATKTFFFLLKPNKKKILQTTFHSPNNSIKILDFIITIFKFLSQNI